MKPYLLLFLSLSLTISLFGQPSPVRPKIGLTLSGGGAKGLAHIGILKAIDSAGLKIDYITGTSMGSIIGSLYAVGYSGNDIEKITRSIDWDILLSNQSSLRSLIMQEKDEYGRYAIELPWVNHNFRLPNGVLEAEELWLKFAELYYPVYKIKDFDDFSIPFKCVSADIATGEAVVLDTGEIVTAIRASMAIPTVFTSVESNGKRLIDGGVVRNFPVQDVREMGADFVIGSRVATGLLPKEKINNALQVLMQVAFFKEAEDSKKEIPLCDIYIPMPLDEYTAASFNKADELLAYGIEQGRVLYPTLKHLADSLNEVFGQVPAPRERIPSVDSVFISSYEVRGLDNTTDDFFTHMMGFLPKKYYTSARLSNMVRRVFGTRYYAKVVYSLVPQDDGSAKIVFDVIENPLTFAKLGIHYNNFTGISLIANLTSRNFFLPHSRSLVTANIGENIRARAEHLQYLGRGKNVALNLGVQFDNIDMSTYNKFEKDGLYDMQLFRADARMEYSSNRKFSLGGGIRYDWVKYRPAIKSVLDIEGRNEFLTGYGFMAFNTLDKPIYPRRGVRIQAEYGWIFNQTPKVTFYSEGEPIGNLDSLGIDYNNYRRVLLNADLFIPLSSRLTFFNYFQGGANINYRQNILNDFSIGGMNKSFRNQILFTGLDENNIETPSVAAFELGVRFQFFNNFYLIAKSNVLAYNYWSASDQFRNPDLLTGHGLTLAYNFALGPLEISAMYCDQSKRVRSYINLGIGF